MHVAAPCFSVLLVASALRELEFTFPLIMNKFSRPISIYGLVCFTPSRLPNSRSTLIYNTRLKKHDAVAGSYGNPYFLRVRRAMLRIELLCAGWRGCGVGLVRAPGACPSPMNTGFRTCVCVSAACGEQLPARHSVPQLRRTSSSASRRARAVARRCFMAVFAVWWCLLHQFVAWRRCILADG